MQPLNELVLIRPWHWGIAVVGDPAAQVPDLVEGRLVSIGERAVVLIVRHAQDIDNERFEGDWNWATATCHVRTLTEDEARSRSVLCDVVLSTPSHSLSLGDADSEVTVTGLEARTRVVVSAADAEVTSLDEVWIDVVPVDA